ncbi:MAG: four helix bundle protein [Minisyncoccia bacterium]
MMQQTVAHLGFVNIAGLRIVDLECVVWSVAVGFVREFAVKREDIAHKIQRKYRYVLALPFAAQKFAPCGKQIFHGNDILIIMTRPDDRLSLGDASILARIKEGYLFWMNLVPHIAKGARYTLGARIENKFLDLLELSYAAYFTEREKKGEKITECIFITDTLKFLVSVAWEGKVISDQQCEGIAVKLEEIGKMLGGWKKSLGNPEKKNRTL